MKPVIIGSLAASAAILIADLVWSPPLWAIWLALWAVLLPLAITEGRRKSR